MTAEQLYKTQLEGLEKDFNKYKSEMDNAYKKYKNKAPNKYWLKIKISESSNAAEYISFWGHNNPEFMKLFNLDAKLAFDIKVKSVDYIYKLLNYPSVLVP